MSTQANKRRFMDPGQTLHDMLDEILVECPQCRACARIVALGTRNRGPFTPRRLACLKCGYTRDWSAHHVGGGQTRRLAVDPFFRAPLWLQAASGQQILWAYNLKHLLLIEAYVSAQLREHRKRSDYGWQN